MVAAWAEVSIWWFIDVDPSGIGVVSAGKKLSAGGDGKATLRTQVSRWTDDLYTRDNKKIGFFCVKGLTHIVKHNRPKEIHSVPL